MTQHMHKRAVNQDSMGDECLAGTNRNHVSLIFFDFTMEPEEISSIVRLTPTSTGRKGERYAIGSPNTGIEKIRKQNHWQYEWIVQTHEFIGDIIERFINEIVVPRVDVLARMAESSSVQFQVVQYYYDGCNPGLYMTPQTITTLANIGASLDVDVYCLGE